MKKKSPGVRTEGGSEGKGGRRKRTEGEEHGVGESGRERDGERGSAG